MMGEKTFPVFEETCAPPFIAQGSWKSVSSR